MCIPSNRRWAEALRHTLRRVYDPTTRMPVPWLLSGDAALNLQGVRVEPHDVLEFRAISPFAAAYFAQLMRPHEAPETTATIVYRRGGNVPPSEGWRSNIHQRVVAWSLGGKATWLGRWLVDDVTVEVSYVRSVHPDPVAMALARREEPRRVRFENMDVPVVPLEHLLVEAVQRNHTEQSQRIMSVLRAAGYDNHLLRRAATGLPEEKSGRLVRLLEFNVIS
ncbi:MAG TPA: hypothetical protein VFR15_05975 [Chloroflexia bacterium]|nr:hypothetical protein [Chloroflexia bacterium]